MVYAAGYGTLVISGASMSSALSKDVVDAVLDFSVDVWLPVVVRVYVHTTPPVLPVVQLSAWNTGLPSIVMSAVSKKPGQSAVPHRH